VHISDRNALDLADNEVADSRMAPAHVAAQGAEARSKPPARRRRIVLVGASNRIAEAIIARFVVDGDSVAGISLERSGNPALVADLTHDCSSEAGAYRAIAEAADALGGIDVLVSVAGFEPIAPAHVTTEVDWRHAISACLDTFFYTARAALPRMTPGSSIVAMSSINSRIAAPWLAAYSAAKGGVDALTRQLAVDYGARGIRVNAVSPGLVGTDRYPDAAAGYPLGRAISFEEVANAVVFLASDQASGIDGVVLPVDGGISITSPATFLRADLRARRENLPD
jgi:meso-butanediol dehydrogenase/(S,S)-butanediol dehydrogenase/diacetyl reductase